MPSPTQRLLEKTIKELEASYISARKEECGELHNAFVNVMVERKASPQNTLFVLELLKHEVLQDCLTKFFEVPITKATED